jgi:hypothetical protein
LISQAREGSYSSTLQESQLALDPPFPSQKMSPPTIPAEALGFSFFLLDSIG